MLASQNLSYISEEVEDAGEMKEVAPPELDVEKVIEYPGFTTEVPPGYIDVSARNRYSFKGK